jgi:hypothetical protein
MMRWAFPFALLGSAAPAQATTIIKNGNLSADNEIVWWRFTVERTRILSSAKVTGPPSTHPLPYLMHQASARGMANTQFRAI